LDKEHKDRHQNALDSSSRTVDRVRQPETDARRDAAEDAEIAGELMDSGQDQAAVDRERHGEG
jgi:hypothetical protein